MNGVARFLSRREKNRDKRSSKHTKSTVSSDVFPFFSKDIAKASKKDDDEKVKALLQRLHTAGIMSLAEPHILHALSMSQNDPDEAYDLLLLANDAIEGVLTHCDPNVQMLGAVNRNMVTCYLDALLFAMFARLGSFERMLLKNFSDEPRKKLVTILRLWVNMLRSGRLIDVDFTEHLQEALAECGWEEAAAVCQQDASEAFTFITDALELPLLTLKMDIYHTGREDKEDDHKYVNERLLEVAIPEEEGDKVITLEMCLESYFNNKIEVKRFLQRQNTIGSMRGAKEDPDKAHVLHVETVEVSGSDSPMISTPTSLYPATPATPSTPLTPARPTEGRRRADSIFSQRYRASKTISNEQKAFDEKGHLEEMWVSAGEGRPRATSLRKEVLMPAWQFFSLIPWYTDSVPQSDAQVAAHFSAERPVLGICLKRYMMLPDGSSKRLDTFIDIPLEIGLPHFVSDDRLDDAGPLFGNFKLVLQSVVCHRGVRIDSGHYVSLIRANKSPETRPTSAQSQPDETPDSWLLFDDLAAQRVTEVDIKQALKDESPYLLFFQVQPIDEELASRGDPPTYAEAQNRNESREGQIGSQEATVIESLEEWEVTLSESSPTSEERTRQSSMSRRSSANIEIDGSLESLPRGRTAPPTPAEEKSGLLSASRRGSKTASGNKSRPSSQSGEGRLSLALSRLSGRGSKDKLHVIDNTVNAEEPVVIINSATTDGVDNSGDALESNGATATLEKLNVLGRNKSRRDKDKGKDKDKKKLRSKSKDPGVQGTSKTRPDRECVVM